MEVRKIDCSTENVSGKSSKSVNRKRRDDSFIIRKATLEFLTMEATLLWCRSARKVEVDGKVNKSKSETTRIKASAAKAGTSQEASNMMPAVKMVGISSTSG